MNEMNGRQWRDVIDKTSGELTVAELFENQRAEYVLALTFFAMLGEQIEVAAAHELWSNGTVQDFRDHLSKTFHRADPKI